MTWTMYIFVRTHHPKTRKRFSKGKMAGQVGHVCMRMGQHLEHFGNSEINEYLNDGEIKLVFKLENKIFDELIDEYHLNREKYPVYMYDYEQGGIFYCSTVRDNTTDEYISFAVFTAKNIDTKEFKLL